MKEIRDNLIKEDKRNKNFIEKAQNSSIINSTENILILFNFSIRFIIEEQCYFLKLLEKVSKIIISKFI